MPIIKQVARQCNHPHKPRVDLYGIGTIWECDNPTCKRLFQLSEDRDGPFWIDMMKSGLSSVEMAEILRKGTK